MLKQLRLIIKQVAPQAEEKISYAMPYYGYQGRLIYFAAFKHHVGVYMMNGSRAVLPKVLRQYRTTSATLQFPLGAKIPTAAIQTMVKAQMKANAARQRLQVKKK